MSPGAQTTQRRYPSLSLIDAFTDFMLSRQAANYTPATLSFYGNTAGAFLAWCEQQGITEPEQITARYVRQYLAASPTWADRTKHTHARAIKTLLRFWLDEGYIAAPVKFVMPKIGKKRLPVLTRQELQTVVKACNVRDRAIVLFIADSDLRRRDYRTELGRCGYAIRPCPR